MNNEDIRPFPIQQGEGRRDERGVFYYPASCTIPWWLAEVAYEHYATLYDNDQSLQRIAERGGFGREELVHLLRRSTHQQMREKIEV
jgi:hypothetical protein